ncbi:MAG: phosphoglucosamine mutase [Vicinamibacteraceae bacterium]|nr:phosphoglucosamine mutase [Vicinamibacteraceae bacterium]
MPPRLFGTDGVRGRAGDYPLDRATVARIGAAVIRALPHGAVEPRVLVGRDTRESGGWIVEELERGIRSEGGRLTSAGILPTPAIAYLTKAMEFDAGIVVSASHNPYEDNGIKVFSGDGEKLDEEFEAHIEATIHDEQWRVGEPKTPPAEAHDLVAAYIAHARTAVPDLAPLRGLRLAIDCANGATTTVAPRLFGELGLEVTLLGHTPDGRNINLGCGSTHPDALSRAVVEGGHRLGVAFDGDGDRAILVDHTGRVVDGDAVMYICAKFLKAHGELRGDAIVATVMSNIGLEIALGRLGLALHRTPVGDKYVAAAIAEHQLSLGGEQSGHIIFSDFLYTGDGIVTALNVLRVMGETGHELADLASEFVAYPQVLVNVRVRERRPIEEVPAIRAAMARVEERLADNGRLLVRYSGTEPLLRVMIEGQDQQEIEAWANEIAGAVRAALG